MKVGSGDYEVMEPGVYEAELIDVTDKNAEGQPLMSRGFQDQPPKPQWKFKFELVDMEDRYLSAWINKPNDEGNLSPNANIVKVAVALYGAEWDPAAEWDVPDLMHRRCRIQVEVYERSDGTEANKIGKYYPAKAKAAPAARRAAPEPDQEPEEAPARPAREPVGAGKRAAPF